MKAFILLVTFTILFYKITIEKKKKKDNTIHTIAVTNLYLIFLEKFILPIKRIDSPFQISHRIEKQKEIQKKI